MISINKLNNFVLIISLVVTIIIMPDVKSDLDKNYLFNVSLIAFINIYLFIISKKRIIKGWFTIDVLFLLGFTIVHFQIPFLSSLGINPENPNFAWINKKVVNYGTWLSLISLIVWIIGYKISTKINLRKLNTSFSNANYMIKTNKIDKDYKKKYKLQKKY